MKGILSHNAISTTAPAELFSQIMRLIDYNPPEHHERSFSIEQKNRLTHLIRHVTERIDTSEFTLAQKARKLLTIIQNNAHTMNSGAMRKTSAAYKNLIQVLEEHKQQHNHELIYKKSEQKIRGALEFAISNNSLHLKTLGEIPTLRLTTAKITPHEPFGTRITPDPGLNKELSKNLISLSAWQKRCMNVIALQGAVEKQIDRFIRTHYQSLIRKGEHKNMRQFVLYSMLFSYYKKHYEEAFGVDTLPTGNTILQNNTTSKKTKSAPPPDHAAHLNDPVLTDLYKQLHNVPFLYLDEVDPKELDALTFLSYEHAFARAVDEAIDTYNEEGLQKLYEQLEIMAEYNRNDAKLFVEQLHAGEHLKQIETPLLDMCFPGKIYMLPPRSTREESYALRLIVSGQKTSKKNAATMSHIIEEWSALRDLVIDLHQEEINLLKKLDQPLRKTT